MHVASSPIIKVSFRRLSSRSTNFRWVFLRMWGLKNMTFFYFSPNQKSDHTFVSQTFDSEQLSLMKFSSKVKIWKKFCKPAKKKYVFHHSEFVYASKWKCFSPELETCWAVDLHPKNWKSVSSHVTSFSLWRFRTFWKNWLTSTYSWRKLL